MDRSSGLRQTPGQFLEFSGVGASKLCDQEDSVGELGGDDRIRHQKQRWRIDQQDVVRLPGGQQHFVQMIRPKRRQRIYTRRVRRENMHARSRIYFDVQRMG